MKTKALVSRQNFCISLNINILVDLPLPQNFSIQLLRKHLFGEKYSNSGIIRSLKRSIFINSNPKKRSEQLILKSINYHMLA